MFKFIFINFFFFSWVEICTEASVTYLEFTQILETFNNTGWNSIFLKSRDYHKAELNTSVLQAKQI